MLLPRPIPSLSEWLHVKFGVNNAISPVPAKGRGGGLVNNNCTYPINCNSAIRSILSEHLIISCCSPHCKHLVCENMAWKEQERGLCSCSGQRSNKRNTEELLWQWYFSLFRSQPPLINFSKVCEERRVEHWALLVCSDCSRASLQDYFQLLIAASSGGRTGDISHWMWQHCCLHYHPSIWG